MDSKIRKLGEIRRELRELVLQIWPLVSTLYYATDTRKGGEEARVHGNLQ